MDEVPEPKKLNNSHIEDGIMTVTLYLDEEGACAKALGALEMTKDIVKDYCFKRQVRIAERKAGIIRPVNGN